MAEISQDELNSYRKNTFRLLPPLRISTLQQAVAFVKERGFIHFWPITGVVLPSLWSAVAGDRPVADAHDDPGHVTWGWKDAMLGGRDWYYAKILRKKSTMIDFDFAPFFYALTENYGAFEEDYLTLYEQGRLSLEAKQVFETLLDQGPLDTVELRRASRMSSPSSESRFNRALADLQSGFQILPIGVTTSGAWHYAFAYDITARRYPELPELARTIEEGHARQIILTKFAISLGAFELREALKLFGWRPPDLINALQGLLEKNMIKRLDQVASFPGEWYALPGLSGC